MRPTRAAHGEDNAHPVAAVGVMAASQNARERIHVGVSCRGVHHSH